MERASLALQQRPNVAWDCENRDNAILGSAISRWTPMDYEFFPCSLLSDSTKMVCP